MEWLARFALGGMIVSVFALFADVIRPKSFAGLFGAAPSVALASLGLTVATNGAEFAAVETRSMLFGALAFVVYALICVYLMAVRRWRAAKSALSAMIVWFIVAGFALWIA